MVNYHFSPSFPLKIDKNDPDTENIPAGNIAALDSLHKKDLAKFQSHNFKKSRYSPQKKIV